MLIDDLYNKEGLDGESNEKAWNRLPKVLQYFISSEHKILMSKIKNNVRSKFGEEGLKSLVKSSGFRSHFTNSRNGGVSDSLHLFGLAADFLKIGIFKDNPIPVCCNLQCIDSGYCWHIQFKRN